MQWTDVIGSAMAGQDLDYDASYWTMDQVMTGELGDARLASFLTAMSVKGPTITEIRGLADAMQDHAEKVQVPVDVLDIVGTGGDRAHTANISTMSSIVLAAAGVPVVKHGNRASTSASGSADVMEALGLNLDLTPGRVGQVFDEVGITFLFANKFHPSMRFAAGVRRALGFPTVFNILGPLTNPARPRASAIGCADAGNAAIMAGVFAQRGAQALVFRGKERGLDELTTNETNEVWEVNGGEIDYFEIDPVKEFDMAPSKLEDLRGGDAEYNADIARRLFDGETGAIRDAVLLNTGAGMVAYGELPGVRTDDGTFIERLGNGVKLAADTIDSGAAADLLRRWIQATNA